MADTPLLILAAVTAAFAALLAAFLVRARFRAQERRLREAGRKFETTFEQAAVGIAHLDREGRWLRINRRFCEIAGYTHEALMTLSVDEITHPDDVAQDRAARAAMMAGALDYSALEKRYVRADGSIVWVAATRSAVRDAEGVPEFFVAVVEEIGARKEAEARLTSGEAQYRAIFDSAVEAMAVIDDEGVIQSVNPSVERVFGYAPTELLGQNISLLMPPAIARDHDGYLARYRETGVKAIIGIGREVIGQRKNGSRFPLDLSVAEWKRGGDSFFTGAMRDVSARKDAEAALRASEERLRLLQNEFAHMARVNDLGEMAAAIAHEINQPLTAIVNYLNAGLFIAAGPCGEEDVAAIEEAMRDASAQALRAGEIVRRLREFVGQGQGDRVIARADELVDAAMALALIDARSSGIEVAREKGAGEAEIAADEVQLQQVLVNVLRNACDAMASGAAARTNRLNVATNIVGKMIEIRVADNGPGIAPELGERVFEPFVTSKAKGMGMGLSVCRRLIEAHGGTIDAVSEAGAGATFTLRLPQAAPKRTKKPLRVV